MKILIIMVSMLIQAGCALNRPVTIQVTNEAGMPIENVRIYADVQRKVGLIYSKLLIHVEGITQKNGEVTLLMPRGKYNGFIFATHPSFSDPRYGPFNDGWFNNDFAEFSVSLEGVK